jgi:hypothetical protein
LLDVPQMLLVRLPRSVDIRDSDIGPAREIPHRETRAESLLHIQLPKRAHQDASSRVEGAQHFDLFGGAVEFPGGFGTRMQLG